MTPRVSPELRSKLAARRHLAEVGVVADGAAEVEAQQLFREVAAPAKVHLAVQHVQAEPQEAFLPATFAMDRDDVDDDQEVFFPSRDWTEAASTTMQFHAACISCELPAVFNAACIMPSSADVVDEAAGLEEVSLCPSTPRPLQKNSALELTPTKIALTPEKVQRSAKDFFPSTPTRRPQMPAELTPEKFQSKDDSSDSFEVDACKLPGHTAPLGGLTSSDREGSIDARSVEHVPVPSAPDRSFFGDSSVDAHSVEHVPAEIRRAQQRAYYAALVTQPLPIAQDCAASQSGRSRTGASEAQVCAELEGRDDEEAESQSSDIADPEPQSLEGSDDEEAESQSSDLGLVDRSDDAEAEPQCLDLVKRIFQAKDRIKQMKYPRPMRGQMQNLFLLYEWLQNGKMSRQRIVRLLESIEAQLDAIQPCQHSDDEAA